MIRYFRLYRYFLQFSISKSFEFRLDFFFRVFMDAFYYLVQLSFYKVLFLNTGSLGGWTEAQVMIFVSAYIMSDAIDMTLFSNNLWMLPVAVNKGDLDYHLVRPVSSLFFLTMREFATNSFLNFLMTLAISIYCLTNYPESIGWERIVLFYLFVFLGALLSVTVRLILITPVFWSHSARGFDQVYWSLTRFIERPDSIFTGWTRKILVSVLPLSVIASFPARVIFDTLTPGFFLHMIGVCVVFFFILVSLWNYALKNYSSASS